MFNTRCHPDKVDSNYQYHKLLTTEHRGDPSMQSIALGCSIRTGTWGSILYRVLKLTYMSYVQYAGCTHKTVPGSIPDHPKGNKMFTYCKPQKRKKTVGEWDAKVFAQANIYVRNPVNSRKIPVIFQS